MLGIECASCLNESRQDKAKQGQLPYLVAIGIATVRAQCQCIEKST